MEYRVLWEIEIEADSYREAAQKALQIQHDPESIATVFIVMDAKDYRYNRKIDLSEEEAKDE